MKNPLTFSRFRFWTLVGVVIPLLACLVTWATGFLLVSYGRGGFPIPWREQVFLSPPVATCHTIGEVACFGSRMIQVNYDWPSFATDVQFYTGIGYSIMLAYAPTGLVLKKLGGRWIQR